MHRRNETRSQQQGSQKMPRHQLGRMQVCNSLQTDNHASTPPLSLLQARCPSCRPTNSVKWRVTKMHPEQNGRIDCNIYPPKNRDGAKNVYI